jgi:ABC-2 type transport system permease protein
MLGRSGSAGVAGIAMMTLWVTSGFHVPVLSAFSPFAWTFDHVALAGVFYWPGLALVGVVAAVFLVAGLETFARRDLGVTSGLSLPSLPGVVLGVHGSLSRAFGEQLPRALAWGLGMGIMGALLASLVGPFAKQMGTDNTLTSTFGRVFPTVDLATAGGWLQLYSELFFIAGGLAATTFVSKWASDETAGRLEMVLATPLARARWVIAGGLAAILAVATMTVVYAAGIWIGSVSGGIDAGNALLGSTALGIYALAVVGVGVAVGGLWRTSLAAEIAALAVLATYLIDLLAPPFNLPDWFHQLALTTHFGTPMTGHWDMAGVAASVAIAAGGILIGAWGMRRRDVA